MISLGMVSGTGAFAVDSLRGSCCWGGLVWLLVYASGFSGFCHGGAGMLSGVVRECSFS